MIEANLNSETRIAEMHLAGSGADLFAEACMFCAAIYKRMTQLDKGLGIAFASALSDYCRDLAEDAMGNIGEVQEQISIDPRIVDIMKDFGNDT